MTIPGIFRTCIYVAAGRAIGAREPDTAVRNPDGLAERLLGDPSIYGIDHPTVRALALAYDEAMASAEVVRAARAADDARADARTAAPDGLSAR